MRFPLPGPSDLLRLSGEGVHAVSEAIDLVPRLIRIIGQVEELMGRVDEVIDHIVAVQARADAAVDSVTRTQRKADAIVARTEDVVTAAEALTRRAGPLLDRYEPLLDRLGPMVEKLVSTTSPGEVAALVRLIDILPELTEKMQQDIIPVLDTLGTVAPDLRDLLDVSKEFNEMLGSIPGLGRVKKRIEEKQELEDSYRAEEEPATAPDRN